MSYFTIAQRKEIATVYKMFSHTPARVGGKTDTASADYPFTRVFSDLFSRY